MSRDGLILSRGEEGTAEATPIIDARQEVRDGIREALPILPAVVPFAAVFGALASERGLSFFEIMFTSSTIYAGASQYAMLDLMGQGIAPWVIVLTVFAINFRHVLYSAAMGRKLSRFSFMQKALAFGMMVDPQFAFTMARAKTRVVTPHFYFGSAFAIYAVWMICNIIGALFGALIENPAAFGFDFILPLYFTGLIIGFRQSQSFLPVLIVSAVCALLVYFTIGSPWHITLGGIGGLLTAAALSKPPEEVRE